MEVLLSLCIVKHDRDFWASNNDYPILYSCAMSESVVWNVLPLLMKEYTLAIAHISLPNRALLGNRRVSGFLLKSFFSRTLARFDFHAPTPRLYTS